MGSVTITTTGCECCCAGASASASISYVSSLQQGCSCGFSEFTDPSTPPKVYRTCTLSGSITGDTYTDNTCSTVTHTRVDTVSGGSGYNESTCAFTDSTNYTIVEDGTTVYDGPIACGPFGAVPGISQSLTQTNETRTGTGACISVAGSWVNYTGSTMVTLTNEDTPADVIARQTPVAGTSNQAWGIIATYPGDCSSPNFEASEQSSNWTLSLSNLVEGCSYTVVISYTSPCGNTTETHTFTADGTTDTLTGSVPQVTGCVTTLSGYVITATDP